MPENIVDGNEGWGFRGLRFWGLGFRVSRLDMLGPGGAGTGGGNGAAEDKGLVINAEYKHTNSSKRRKHTKKGEMDFMNPKPSAPAPPPPRRPASQAQERQGTPEVWKAKEPLMSSRPSFERFSAFGL